MDDSKYDKTTKRNQKQQQQLVRRPPPPKSRLPRRRSTPFYLRWLSVFASIAVIRTIYKSAAFTRRSAVIGDVNVEDWDVPRYLADFSFHPILRRPYAQSQQQQQQQQQRSRRVKRPRKNPSRESLQSVSLGVSVSSYSDPVDSSSSSSSSSVQPSIISSDKKKSKDESSYWKSLCQGGKSGGKKLSSKSKVLLSGILSHTVTVELALALKNHCGVKTIVGLSSESPHDNTIPPRIAYLLRRLPDLEFIQHDTLFSQERLGAIIASVKPTHVVHFESTTLLSSESSSSSSPSPLATIPSTIRVRESLESLDRLGRAIVTWQNGPSTTTNRKSNAKKDVVAPVRFLYVSTPLPKDQSIYEAGALDLAYPLLLQTFRMHYSLDVFHLKLPNIYGPFHESKLSAASLVPPAGFTTTTTTKDNKPSSSDDRSSLVHIDDSVQSLVASMTCAKSNIPTLPQIHVPPSSITTAKEIIRSLRKKVTASSSGPSKLRIDRAKLMLSWYHQDTFPFSEPSDVYTNATRSMFRKVLVSTNRRLESGKTDGISLLQRRQNALFPCDSECAVNSPCRKTSAFTKLIPISQNITQNCRFVLFTTDFSVEASDLPLMKENMTVEVPWPKDSICQVAFVSGKSTLVRSLIKREGKTKKDMASLNGNLQHNRWSVIWLPDDDETSLSEADYLFPKLSPRPFLAHNVTKSFYVQPRQSASFPPLPIIWFLMAKQLDSKKQGERVKLVRRSGTSIPVRVTLPALPARHSALFAHSMGLSPSLIKSSSMEAVAKFVLKKRELDYTDRSLPERQLEYYDFAKTWYDFQLPDTFLLIQNLQSDRSRSLRCEWYEEHLFWADDDDHSNRNLEDLSLAYVLGRWKANQRLVSHDDYNEKWGDRIVDTAKGDFLDHAISNNVSASPESQYFVKLQGPINVQNKKSNS